jgi:uncharacterized protein
MTMPLFALICHDSPGYLETRKQNREAHLAYISETGVVVQAGPLLDQGGEMCGSLLILDVPDRDAALHWAASDPYALAGLFESVTLREWKKVIG